MITHPYQITNHKEARKEMFGSNMKKCSTRIGVLSIILSVIFLVVSAGIKAEAQDGPKKNLLSELHIESAGLLSPKSNAVEEKDIKTNPFQGVMIPLKEGLNGFIDCTPPRHQDDLAPNNGRTNYRAVIGFHFTLR